jgi:hypothetical protein
VRFGFLVVALFGAVLFLVVAARAVVLFDFAFLDDFFVGAFFVEAFFFGAAAARLAFRLWGFLVRFLAAPIAAPERAPITVPMTGTPRAVPATARGCATERASHRAFFCVSGVVFLFLIVHVLLPELAVTTLSFAGLPANDEQPFINWICCFRLREAKWK